jgi:hypothetical protein
MTNGEIPQSILSTLQLQAKATAHQIAQALDALRAHDSQSAGEVEQMLNDAIHQARGSAPREWQPVWPS